MNTESKPLIWIGDTRKCLKDFPAEVQDFMGFALRYAQSGGKHPNAKPLKGFEGAGVIEVIDNYDSDTYRAVYTVRFAKVVYALHAFKKKSKQGIKTPQQEMDTINKRYTQAKQQYNEWLNNERSEP